MLCVSGNCKWCMFVISNLHKHYIQRQKRPTKLHVNPCRYFDTFKKKVRFLDIYFHSPDVRNLYNTLQDSFSKTVNQ